MAIGGINAGNILQLSGSGVDDAAAVSAIFAQPDPGRATAELVRLAEKMVLPMDKRFAIFDMDGTLMDSAVFWRNLAGEYLARQGVEQVPPEIIETIRTMTMSRSAALFQREFRLQDLPEQINAVMEEHYQRDIPLKPGAARYLLALHKRGVRMCVA